MQFKIGLKRKRPDSSAGSARWRVGILVLLTTLVIFSRAPDADEPRYSELEIRVDDIEDIPEETQLQDLEKPSPDLAGGDSDSGFDLLHDVLDDSTLEEQQSEEVSEEVSEIPGVQEEVEVVAPPPPEIRGWAREGSKSRLGQLIESGNSSISKRSRSPAPEGRDPIRDRLISAGNRRAGNRKGECKSGDVDSARHMQRVWGQLDGGRINFRVSGDMVSDTKNRMPIILNSKQFFRFNKTLARKQVRDSLIVRVPGEPEWKLHFDPKLIALLPNSEPTWHFKSCSLVGNSGEILNKEYGSEIDSHQAVFRLNYAPTRGYERYVGSRTTFDVVNQQHTKVFVPEVQAGGHLPEAKRSSARESIITVFEVDKPFASRQLYPPLLRRFNSANSRSKSRVAIMSPELVLHSHHVWKRMKKAVENAAGRPTHYHSKPMSGFFAIMLGVQICEQVHLYGFSPYKKGEKLYHYFDATPAVTTAHSFDLGFEIFRQMATWPCSDVKVYVHSDR